MPASIPELQPLSTLASHRLDLNMIKSSLILVLIAATFALSAKLPSKWKKCPPTDNEECLSVAIQEAIQDLKNGNKGMHMIPLDPLHFKRLELNQGGTSPVNINLTFYELDLIGASRLKVNSARFDMDKHEVEINANVINGDSHLVGDYTIAGSVLILPIRGQGKSNITFEDLNFILTLKGKEESKNGKKYFKVEEAEFNMNPKRVRFWFGNLFDGVPNLGDGMNKFLNENWKEITGELKGTISQAMGVALKQVSNQLFNRVPMDQLQSS